MTQRYTTNHAETNLSAEKAQTSTNTRVSRARKNSRGPQDHPPPPPQGQSAPVCIMLPMTRRLSASEVRKVLKEGGRVRSRYLSARFVRCPKGKEAFAAIVPLRIARTSVERNAARRALYRAISPLSSTAVRAAVLLERRPEGKVWKLLAADVSELFRQIRSSVQKTR